MEATTHRLFTCARCHRLCRICTHCDHGNVHCGEACRAARRTE